MFTAKLNKLLKKKKPTIQDVKPFDIREEKVKWDNQYQKGQWDYLAGIEELAHYSMIVGYCENVLSEHSRLLDVGCGEGVLQTRLRYLPYEKYIGIDISEVAIQKANQFQDERTTFIATDADSYIPPHKVDIIVFNETLYYFNNLDSTIHHYDKYLEDDGFFIVSMFDQKESDECWKYLDEHYSVLDSTKLTNASGLSWNCKLIMKPAITQ